MPSSCEEEEEYEEEEGFAASPSKKTASDPQRGFRPLVRHLATYFTNVQDLYPEDARDKAQGIAQGLADSGIRLGDLVTEIQTLANDGIREDEYGIALMDYFKVRCMPHLSTTATYI